jgi:molybdopterin-guanine dinucleotide biosynthesis protein B
VTAKLLGIVGFKNAGKTTLTERLVSELTARNYRISTVKHAHHAFDIDQEGRDSWRHRQAGAREVAVVSANRWALVHELRGTPEPALQDIVGKLGPCDLVLTEGYKWEKHPKIEVRNLSLAHPELAGKDSTVIAIAANGVIKNSPVPVFDREDVKAIADFIVDRMELSRHE